MIPVGTLCITLADDHGNDVSDFAPYVGRCCTVIGHLPGQLSPISKSLIDHCCEFEDGAVWEMGRRVLLPITPPPVDAQTLRERELVA